MFSDAEAIAEAVERENMRFVPIKTDEQLDLQALHRVLDRLVARRTAVINQVRAFLLERGITFRKGPASLRWQMPEILEDGAMQLSPRMRLLLATLWQEWKHLEEQVEVLSAEIGRSVMTIRPASGCGRLPGWGRWSRPRSWLPSVMVQPSAKVASLPAGSAWSRGSTRLAAGRSYSASANEGTLTYERCSFMAPELQCCLKRERSLIGKWMEGWRHEHRATC